MEELPPGLESRAQAEGTVCSMSTVRYIFGLGGQGNRKAQVPLTWEFGSPRYIIEPSSIQLAPLTFWPDNSFLLGAILCIVGCLAAALVSAHDN